MNRQPSGSVALLLREPGINFLSTSTQPRVLTVWLSVLRLSLPVTAYVSGTWTRIDRFTAQKPRSAVWPQSSPIRDGKPGVPRAPPMTSVLPLVPIRRVGQQ
jgi:hypothetical protein